MLYFSQVDFPDQNQLEELDSAELIKHKLYSKEFCLLLIGVEQGNTKKDHRRHLLINPVNYIIKNEDVGYFVAQSRESALKTLQKISQEGAGLLRYEQIIEQYDKFNFMEHMKTTIHTLYENLINQSKNWKQKIPPYSAKKDNIFDLNLGDSIRGYFSNHIIIKGSLLDFKNIIQIIRFYSDRPILIFSQDAVDFSKWTKIKESYPNVYYIRGIQHSLDHITELEPKHAYKILVMSQSQDALFLDTDTIVFARILKDFFKVKRILVELADESMIRFLEIRPKFNLLHKNLDLSFFWPSFVSGNIHYSSLLMSLVARSLYNSNWIFFFKELSNPRVYNDTQINNEKIIKENSNLCTLEITEEIANNVVIYGKLQYLLMSSNPCIISLALMKKRKNEGRLTNILFEKMVKNASRKMGHLKNNFMETMNSLYGTKFFLTNPAYFTKLSPGDEVLVLGMDNLKLKINENIKVEHQFIDKLKKNLMLPPIKKKRTSMLVSIAEAKKKTAEVEFKNLFKIQALEMIKGLNETMKKSIGCFEMLNRRELVWRNEQEENKKN